MVKDNTKKSLESNLNCCGLFNNTESADTFKTDVEFCPAACKKTRCLSCGEVMMEHAGEVLKILGGVGLFFSFTEVRMPIRPNREGQRTAALPLLICFCAAILGVWLAMRYRNQKDPRANPSAFL
ncbi:hypothetical protein JD844_010883 [Phrynosoma platyrhinos]|uniref:Uncharacterized protein n=1 Tax=Phrynosoma platyrhinos TaxID=52577 RepID=A0ABQ7THZ8_PHRPL|nr:hypothetical protein JD844_010883 [Phrynosoma platyrhinos]